MSTAWVLVVEREKVPGRSCKQVGLMLFFLPLNVD